MWNNDVEDENKEKAENLLRWWETQNNKEIPPGMGFDENSPLKINDLLRFFIQESYHWLNKAESEFILESWERRNDRIAQLKRQRDEAIVGGLAAKARQIYPEDQTIGLNLALAACALIPSEEALAIRDEIFSKPATVFYKNKFKHPSEVRAVAYSPDGSKILIGTRYGNIICWNLETGAQEYSVEHNPKEDGRYATIRTLAYSPGGTRFVSGSRDNTAIVWNAHTGARLEEIKHSTDVVAVVFSP